MQKKIERCPTCGQAQKRSKAQNRLYWRLLHLIKDHLQVSGKGYTADTWAEYLKQRYLGSEEVELPNGKVITKTVSTTSLDVEEFNKYFEECVAWAASQGVYLPDEEGNI